jgi:hypothetical protein
MHATPAQAAAYQAALFMDLAGAISAINEPEGFQSFLSNLSRIPADSDQAHQLVHAAMAYMPYRWGAREVSREDLAFGVAHQMEIFGIRFDKSRFMERATS